MPTMGGVLAGHRHGAKRRAIIARGRQKAFTTSSARGSTPADGYAATASRCFTAGSHHSPGPSQAFPEAGTRWAPGARSRLEQFHDTFSGRSGCKRSNGRAGQPKAIRLRRLKRAPYTPPREQATIRQQAAPLYDHAFARCHYYRQLRCWLHHDEAGRGQAGRH